MELYWKMFSLLAMFHKRQENNEMEKDFQSKKCQRDSKSLRRLLGRRLTRVQDRQSNQIHYTWTTRRLCDSKETFTSKIAKKIRNKFAR